MPFTAVLETGDDGTGTVDSATTSSTTTFGGADSVPIDIGSLSVGGGTRLEINATDLTALKNGFSSLVIGGNGQNEGPVQVGAVTATSAFNEPVTIFGTEITVSDQVDGDTKITLFSRTGSSTVLDGGSLNVAQSGSDIEITSEQHIYIDDGGSLSADDSVTLTATLGSIGPDSSPDPGLVSGATLIGNAETGIDLKTTVSSLGAHVNGTGPIEVDETDAITLTDIDTADGSIEITAGGTIDAEDVATLTDDDITLTAEAGDIKVGLITTTSGLSGDVTLTSQSGAITDASVDTSVDVVGDLATFTAVTGIGTSDTNGDLDVRLNMLKASNSGVTGDIVLTELTSGGALEIQKLAQSNAGGAGFVKVQVESGLLTLSTDGATVTGSGSLHLESLAGAIQQDALISSTSGQVSVQAQGGGLTIADSVTVTTGSGHILFEASLDIQVGAGGFIHSTDGGSMTLLASGSIQQNGNLETTSGTIDVEATTGSITMADGASTVTKGKNIRYDAASDVVLGLLDTRDGTLLNQENWGEASIRAGTGTITDAASDGDTVLDIYASSARFFDANGLGTASDFIETEVVTVSSESGSGGIDLIDSTAVTVGTIGTVPVTRVLLSDISTKQDTVSQAGLKTAGGSNGRIVLVTTDGAMEVLEPVMADGSGNILLHARGGQGDNIVLENAVESGSGHVSIIGADVGNAFVSVRPDGDDNDILLKALSGGSDLSGVTVLFFDDGTLIGDDASAAFNAFTRTLSINIRNGFTTANTIISAIDNEGTFDASRDTRVETANDGTGTLHTADSAGTGGGDFDTKAFVDVLPFGPDNDLTFTVAIEGSEFNGAVVRFVDDGTITDGSAEAIYTIITKVLTINIQNGVTTANAVIAALNPEEHFFGASLNTAFETNTGGGVLHTPPVVTVFNQTVTQTGAGDIRVIAVSYTHLRAHET